MPKAVKKVAKAELRMPVKKVKALVKVAKKVVEKKEAWALSRVADSVPVEVEPLVEYHEGKRIIEVVKEEVVNGKVVRTVKCEDGATYHA